MGLLKLYSYNLEIQYKSYFLSKATLFSLIVTLLNIVLPFVIAFKSRGFWMKSHSFYEKPTVGFTYEYLLVAQTDDPSQYLVCAEGLYENIENEDHCAEIQVQELDNNGDGKNDVLNFEFKLNVPRGRTITSLDVTLALDFQIKATCPLHMQSFAMMNKDFVVPPSGLKFFGDLEFYQITHLPCKSNYIDTRYNVSLLRYSERNHDYLGNLLLEYYYVREVITNTKTIYSRTQNGHTGTMLVQIHLRVPEMKILYMPSIMQELRWAWPQYLSLVVVFYWILNRIKRFVFKHRLLMAWEIVPWKKVQ